MLQVRKPETESVISKLHYRVTSIMFLVSSIAALLIYDQKALNILDAHIHSSLAVAE